MAYLACTLIDCVAIWSLDGWVSRSMTEFVARSHLVVHVLNNMRRRQHQLQFIRAQFISQNRENNKKRCLQDRHIHCTIIVMCAQKLTDARLIYRKEPETKTKREELKTKMDTGLSLIHI